MAVNLSLSNAEFQKQLAFGQMAETAISKWIIGLGGIVVPAYDSENNKGPRIFSLEGSLVAPDLLIFRQGKPNWIEAKHKSVFSWRGVGGFWETGIDAHHYRDYLKVEEKTNIPLFLLFYHESDIPWIKDRQRWPDCPARCPTGLYCVRPTEQQGRFGKEHGRHGMYYWREKDQLIFLKQKI